MRTIPRTGTIQNKNLKIISFHSTLSSLLSQPWLTLLPSYQVLSVIPIFHRYTSLSSDSGGPMLISHREKLNNYDIHLCFEEWNIIYSYYLSSRAFIPSNGRYHFSENSRFLDLLLARLFSEICIWWEISRPLIGSNSRGESIFIVTQLQEMLIG